MANTKVVELKTKRFVIRKSLIGTNTVITFRHSVDNMTICHVTSCHDKESWWYTSQCKLSTKQSLYFYKLNTSLNG